MKRKIRKILKFVPMILIMVLIFYFSTMEGDESSQTSGVFLQALAKIAEGMTHRGISNETLAALHLIIRKIAHFTEYAALGASVLFGMWDFIKGKKTVFLWPELVAMLYATSDEIHQYFVPGRYGTWTDVLIDSCGAFAGILIFNIILRKKKNEEI